MQPISPLLEKTANALAGKCKDLPSRRSGQTLCAKAALFVVPKELDQSRTTHVTKNRWPLGVVSRTVCTKTQVTQAQTESSARPGRQAHTSIVDQARQLRAAVVTGQAFRLWLGRQESKRMAGRGEGGGVSAVAGAAVAIEGKKAADRTLISRSVGGQHRAAGASRFKSREHPRVVIKDLDGLEPDRVQVSIGTATPRGGFGSCAAWAHAWDG